MHVTPRLSALFFALFLLSAPGAQAFPGMSAAGGPLAASKPERWMFDLIAGAIAEHRGDYAFASDAYLDALGAYPENDIAQAAWRAAVQSRSEERVLEASRRWLAVDPKNNVARQALLADALGRRDEKAAAQELDAMLAAAPDKAVWTAEMLEALSRLNIDKNFALKIIAPYEARYARNARVRMGSALLLASAGRNEDACRFALDAQTRSPQDGRILSHAADLCFALAPDEIMRRLSAYLKKHPDDSGVRLIYGRTLARTGERARALREADRALRSRHAGDADLYTAGLLATEAGAPEEALRRFKDYAARLRDDGRAPARSDVWLRIGRLELEAARPERAAEAFVNAVDGPWSTEARLGRAEATAAAGRTDEALAQLKTSAKDQPERFGLFMLAAAELAVEHNRRTVASQLLDELLQTRPDADVRYDAAMLFERLGNRRRTVETLESLLAEAPQHVQAANALGYLWVDADENLPQARALLESAFAREPLDPNILDSMGWLCYREGRYDDAVDYVMQSLRRRFDETVAEHLIEILVALGRCNEAQSLLEELKAKAPQTDVRALAERLHLRDEP